MINELPRQSHTTEAFHCAVIPDHQRVLRAAGVDSAGIDELLGQTRLPAESAEGIFYEAFNAPRGRKFHQTRFSDGTWAVRYTAIEADTASAEFLHGRLTRFGITELPDVDVQFGQFVCLFRGDIKDLRPMRSEWLFLTADDGYGDCNRVARAALDEDLSGLLTPSARNANGTCLPIFRRDAASQVRLVRSRHFRHSSATDNWAEVE